MVWLGMKMFQKINPILLTIFSSCYSYALEKYLNPLVYPQHLNLDKNETVSYSVSKNLKNGNIKLFNEVIEKKRGNIPVFSSFNENEYLVVSEYEIMNGEQNTTSVLESFYLGNLYFNSKGRTTTTIYEAKPMTKYIENNQSWRNMYLGSWSYDYNESVSVAITTETNSTTTVVGTELVKTVWGELHALVLKTIAFDYHKFSFNENVGYSAVIGSRETTDYFINRIGIYKSISKYSDLTHINDLKSKIDDEAYFNFIWAVLGGEDSYQTIVDDFIKNHDISSVVREFKSTNKLLTPIDYLILNSGTSTTELNTWTWNGAFPWVYNHETESWFYYHFAGNTCNAYDARNGNCLLLTVPLILGSNRIK